MAPTTTSPSSPSLPGAPSIDPRLRARRIAVQRQEGRRRFRRLLIVAVVLAVALIGVGVTRTPLLDVDSVRVAGAQHTPVEAVVAATGIKRGAPMTDADLGRAQRRVAALPWVASAAVKRHWPGTIKVEVEERKAVAAVALASGGWLVVDAGGQFLQAVPELGTDVVALHGITVDAQPGERLGQPGRNLLDLAAALPPALAGKVTATSATPEGELQLTLADGAVVRVGDANDLGAKLVAIETIIDKVDLTCLAVVDVRVASAPVLTRNRNCD